MSDTIPSDAPCPRLCHLKKWSDFNGYGFNLHAERGKAGQFIGTIDPGSPAELAHLRAGDRIVEVNGTNIGSENHQQVVQRIKAVASETRLLVVDSEADDYYREHKILIRGDMPNVEYHVTPDHNPLTHPKSDISLPMDHMKISEPDYSKYHARLCQLKIWSDFPGYGFNLHADRAGLGQFIGKVDDGSPAEAAGLREGDRIIEVNGVDITGKTHGEVVTEVKSRHGEVDMLVVDQDADSHLREHGVMINGRMPGIVTITCPTRSVNGGTATVDKNSNEDVVDNRFEEAKTEAKMAPSPVAQPRSAPPAPAAVVQPSASTASSTSSSSTPSGSAAVTVGGIEFAGSAKEARERMNKKRNVKNDQSLSMKDKYELLQKL